MSNRWPVQSAKDRFSEILAATLANGPQIVTKRGVEPQCSFLSSSGEVWNEWTRLDLKELLLASEPRTEHLIPPRPQHPCRTL